MKYGDTLRQRSIPEWGHYNIDYDYLKDLIKHQTTSGTNKAVSIPGQGGTTERAFGDTFLTVLQAQHDRINLFVRSKSGEIERRLEHISRSLQLLRERRPVNASEARLPARTVERYAKIDADVARTAEEIRSLSRFQVVQRTGFAKILKKYRRWTKDRELDRVFKEEISNRPDSLFQLDLGHLLDQYVEVLGSLRTVFDDDTVSATYSKDTSVRLPAARIARALDQHDDLDFDLALSTIPLGADGSKATYWVHPDHIVEVQVLLLQHMRLHSKGSRPSSQRESVSTTPARRPSSSANFDRNFGGEDYTGLVVLDYAEAFAVKQNASTIASSEGNKGTIGLQAAGNVRCLPSGDAAVAICTKTSSFEDAPENIKIAKLKRKFVDTFLDTSKPFSNTSSIDFAKQETHSSDEDEADITTIREWLTEHQEVKPIAGVGSKRTRFVGLHNNSVGGIWASLDRDVFMKGSLIHDLENDEWASTASSNSVKFPHAILEVRREGETAMSLIKTLDRSHLVERVRGFSIEAHAVWTCCRPTSMSTPLWISLLDKDIRKLPEPVKRRSRKARSSTTGSYSQTSPPLTSASNTSHDGQLSPVTVRHEESSVTSPHEYVDPPPLQAFKKKHRKPFSDYQPPVIHEQPEQPRYWNEYDNPEDEDEGYYIYIDPNASVKFPGQETIEAWANKTRKLFGMRIQADEQSLLSAVDESTDDEDTADESSTGRPSRSNYGTMASQRGAQDGYFSGLFGARVDPHRTAEVLEERRSLLGQLQVRQRKAERAKFRLYTMCLATATVIDVMLGLMTVTSRKKERGAVDAGVLFGTICTLILCGVAVISMKTRKDHLSWVHQGLMLSVVAAVIGLDVLLLLWVLRV